MKNSTQALAEATCAKLMEVAKGTVLRLDCGKINRSPITVRQRISWVNRDKYKLDLKFSMVGDVLEVWTGDRILDKLPEVQSADKSSAMVTTKCSDKLLAAYRVLLEEQVFVTIEIIGVSPEELTEEYPKLMSYFTFVETQMGTVLT